MSRMGYIETFVTSLPKVAGRPLSGLSPGEIEGKP
jgi:hypothetical protein